MTENATAPFRASTCFSFFLFSCSLRFDCVDAKRRSGAHRTCAGCHADVCAEGLGGERARSKNEPFFFVCPVLGRERLVACRGAVAVGACLAVSAGVSKSVFFFCVGLTDLTG